MQTSKSGLHLLLTANIQRQLAANLIPTVSGGAYYDAREVTLEWNDARNIGFYLKSEAGCTKRVPTHSFLPYLFPRKGKDRAAGGDGSRKFATTIPQSPSVTAPFTQGSRPWEGRLGVS